MIQILLVILILLLPASSEAAYKIYLKNGSVISGVHSYEKKGGEVTVYFSRGSMAVSEKDILKIVETEEARLVASINEKRGKKYYNVIQLRQIEKETEPLQQELVSIQQKKADLIQRKASIEGELRALQ